LDFECIAGIWGEVAAKRGEVLLNDLGCDAPRGDCGSEVALDLFDGERDCRAGCSAGSDFGNGDIDEGAFGVASALEDELSNQGVGYRGGVEVGAALEAVGGVCVEAVAAGAAADGGLIKPCGFDEDVLCVGCDHGVPAAHDSG
jgi:hypothetical protein